MRYIETLALNVSTVIGVRYYISVVNGWSSWTAYSRCSKTCYYGLQTRSRKCSSASSSACPGPSVERQRCNERVSCLGKNLDNLTTFKGQT